MMDKLGLIAGGGALPLRVAERCRQTDRPVFVVRLKGFAEAGLPDPARYRTPGAPTPPPAGPLA